VTEPKPTPSILPRDTELSRLVRRPIEFARAYRWPLALLLIGATADVITTCRNLVLYGPEVEAHVVQRWVSELVGVHAGVPLAKLIQLAFVLFVAAWWRPWTVWLLTACGLLYSAAAVSNHFLLL
jgi:CHASE2 domain-containing sensor protein